MALLTSYGDYNKVTDSALNVKYSVEMGTMRMIGTGAQGQTVVYNQPYYRVSRYAQKQYEYVGMNYETAVSCQNAKIDQYTRSYSRIVEITMDDPTWTPPVSDPDAQPPQITTLSSEPFIGCTSDIVAQHQDGGMWKVSVSVNETDEKPSIQFPTRPANLFTDENRREYDE